MSRSPLYVPKTPMPIWGLMATLVQSDANPTQSTHTAAGSGSPSWSGSRCARFSSAARSGRSSAAVRPKNTFIFLDHFPAFSQLQPTPYCPCARGVLIVHADSEPIGGCNPCYTLFHSISPYLGLQARATRSPISSTFRPVRIGPAKYLTNPLRPSGPGKKHPKNNNIDPDQLAVHSLARRPRPRGLSCGPTYHLRF